MVRAERNEHRARASAIDERDVQVLLLLLEHKILTTHQITSLCFRSLRRCQHLVSGELFDKVHASWTRTPPAGTGAGSMTTT
jgi:hypothetical protein